MTATRFGLAGRRRFQTTAGPILPTIAALRFLVRLVAGACSRGPLERPQVLTREGREVGFEGVVCWRAVHAGTIGVFQGR